MAASSQKRSKSLSEFTSGDIQSSPSAVSSALSLGFGYSTDSQVNTTSGVYSSAQRQRLCSAPNVKGMQPLSHAPTMMSTKPSPTMNHFALPRGYSQVTQPPPYGHYQGYPSYGSYAAGGSYQTQAPFSPTYNNYSSGAVTGSPYLVHSGPPGSSIYSINARPPAYPGQQPSMNMMSGGYFPYSSSTSLPAAASTGAMTTQSSYNRTTAGYPPGYTSSSAMYSQPPVATTSLNVVTEQQSVVPAPMPVATSSSIGEVATLDLPTATGELDTSHDSAASDSSFPVVSLPSSAQHQGTLSELDVQGGRSPEADGTVGETSETSLINESNSATSENSAEAGASEKEQLYTKRSVGLYNV